MPSAGQQFVESNRQGDRFPGSPGAAPYDTPPPPDWPGVARRDAAGARRLRLDRAVELDVVPRLVLAGRGAAVAMPAPALLTGSVEELARLAMDKDSARAFAFADQACASGVTLEALYLDLLAPAARHLGDLWSDDRVDFGQVTIGLGHLHRVLRAFSPAFQSGVTQAQTDRRALLVAAPGENHTFGLAMVTEFFRRASWVVWSGAPAPGAELVAIVRDNWFAVAGFSLAYEGRLEALRTGIRNVRRASQNRSIRIMVGGPVFIAHPEFVAQVGADAMAVDGRQAVTQAQGLLQLLSDRI